MNPITRCLHTRTETVQALPSVTPLYQVSAFDSGSSFFYTRKNNPNIAEFEEVVRELEGAKHGIAVASGMAALRICLERLQPGDTMVMNNLVYGCTFKLVQRVCHHLSVHLVIMDLSVPVAIDSIPASTALILFETPTNPFLKTIDISRLISIVRVVAPKALVVVDNTWATPLYQRPIELGADVSLHSATKYLSGHSDVMGGVILTDSADLADAFRQERFFAGAILDPHAAWLLRRSMQTVGVRLERQGRTTSEICSFLKMLPQVEKVFYPDIDGRQLRGYGGIVFFEIRSDLIARYPELLKALRYFGSGTGMACVTSMIAQPYTGSHASMNDEEKSQMGLSRGLVRLCFGLEDPEDLKQDLQYALSSIDPIKHRDCTGVSSSDTVVVGP